MAHQSVCKRKHVFDMRVMVFVFILIALLLECYSVNNQNDFIFFSVKLGVGGFSMGAATALYSATCHILGQYGNGNLYPVNLSAVVGLSGWLPCSRFGF